MRWRSIKPTLSRSADERYPLAAVAALLPDQGPNPLPQGSAAYSWAAVGAQDRETSDQPASECIASPYRLLPDGGELYSDSELIAGLPQSTHPRALATPERAWVTG